MPDDRSIARSAVIRVIRRDQHARSGHILDDNVGFTGNVLTEMARNKSSVRIVATAGATADDELDGFALVEVLHRSSRRRDQRYRDKNRNQKYTECFRHEPPTYHLAVAAGT
jgi:hypothetical protein